MRKVILPLLFPITILLGCSTKNATSLENFYFLKGKWHSIGADSYETWELVNDTLKSATYLFKNDSLLLLDNSIIVRNKQSVNLLMHVNKVAGTPAHYELVYDKEEDKWLFQNKQEFPPIVYYEYRKEKDNIYAFVKDGHKKIEFLYEKIDSLPK